MSTLRATYARTLMTLGYAKAQITSATTTTRTTEDGRQEHQAQCVVRNIGDYGNDFEVRFYDATLGKPNPATQPSLEAQMGFIDVGASRGFTMTTWHLVELVKVFGIWAWPVHTWPGAPDFNDYAAYLEARVVTTTLTIAVSPAKPSPGSAITISGRLTRDDTGQGVPTQPVYLKTWPGTDPAAPPPATGVIDYGTATTNANGNYSKQVTAPTVAGKYVFDSTFLGAAGLGLSNARQIMETEEAVIEIVSLFALAAFLVGLTATAVGAKGY